MDSDSLIVTSTMFSLQKPGEYSEKYHYSRYGNPTRDSLEATLAELDDAQFAVTYSSKVAASLALLSTLETGDRVIFNDHGTCQKLKALCPQIEMEFRDLQHVDDVRKAFETDVRMLWMEVPASLFMTVLDLKQVAGIVRSMPKAVFVVDNTLFTPHFLKPLNFGADAVICSLVEFVAGHSDVAMGSVVTNSETLHGPLRCHQYSYGMVPSPFDCFLVQRSLKTLSLRMEKHSQNSAAIAKFLESHPEVKRVIHTSLAEHFNRHDISRQFKGHCGVLSFHTKSADSEAFLGSLKMIKITDTLGGTETTARLGSKCGLIRISVGLECERKLIADLRQALNCDSV